MEFKFIGTISKQGENLVIWIPKDLHDNVKPLREKQLKVILTDDW